MPKTTKVVVTNLSNGEVMKIINASELRLSNGVVEFRRPYSETLVGIMHFMPGVLVSLEELEE